MDNSKEISYKGIAFRSKLEAKWALFFDTLGIIYRYETKAHEYEEVTILPSFYLPQYNSFAIVKEQFLPSKEISEEEEDQLEAIKLLSIYTGKEIYIFIGDAWLPGEPDSYRCHVYHPLAIYTHPVGKMMGDEGTEKIEASLMVKLILQKFEDCNIEGVISQGQLYLHSTKPLHESDINENMEYYLEYMQYQQECLTETAPLIAQHYHDLVTVLTVKPDRVFFIIGADLNGFNSAWAECSECGDVSLKLHLDDETYMHHQECKSSNQGTYKINSPRLLAAYAAARKGNFEEFF